MIGVSNDDHQTQCDFAKSLGVSFPMIGDSSMGIAKSYGVKWPLSRLAQRVTFVIDGNGTVRDVFHHELAVGRHAEDALRSLEKLANGADRT